MQYPCAPNPVIHEVWGPQHTSKRDRPMDLYKALEKRGIPMMLYFFARPMDAAPRAKLVREYKRFDRWIEVAQWYSDHYGTKCQGWWVDFLLEYTKDYRVNIHNALKHGNPEAIVASGTLELSDYLHGHCMPDWNRQSKVVKPFFGRWDPDFNIQWHVFQYIGPNWAEPGCNKRTEDLVKYALDVVKGGGVITFDLATHKKVNGRDTGPFLEIQPDQFEILRAVRDALKGIKPIDGSGE